MEASETVGGIHVEFALEETYEEVYDTITLEHLYLLRGEEVDLVGFYQNLRLKISREPITFATPCAALQFS